MVPWNVVNHGLTVLWARYWALKDADPQEAATLKAHILAFTKALRVA